MQESIKGWREGNVIHLPSPQFARPAGPFPAAHSEELREAWHADNPKAAPSLIDRLVPYIIITGLFALIALGNILADWVVAL